MAKNKEPSFIDIVDEPSSPSSIEDAKAKRMDELEEYVNNVADTVNQNAKVTNRLARKIDRLSKSLSRPRIKKLFENATKLNKIVDKDKTGEVKEKATKVDKLEENDPMLDILNKILSFMQKTYEEDKLASEEKRNYEEELSMEKSRKQKAMLDALVGKKKQQKEKERAEKEEDNSGLLDKILGAFGGLAALEVVGAFFLSPPGLVVLGGIAVLASAVWGAIKLGGWLDKKKEERAEEAGGKDAVEASKRMDAASGGANYDETGTLMNKSNPEYDKAKEDYDKAVAKKKGVMRQLMEKKGYTLMQGKNWLGIPYEVFRDKDGKEAPPEVLKQTSKEANVQLEQDKQKAAPAPALTPAPAAATPTPQPAPSPSTQEQTSTSSAPAVPVPSTPPSAPVSQLSSMNADMKLDDLVGKAQEALSNAKTNIMNLMKDRSDKGVPPVRNQEATFQRMIMNNTRVV